MRLVLRSNALDFSLQRTQLFKTRHSALFRDIPGHQMRRIPPTDAPHSFIRCTAKVPHANHNINNLAQQSQ